MVVAKHRVIYVWVLLAKTMDDIWVCAISRNNNGGGRAQNNASRSDDDAIAAHVLLSRMLIFITSYARLSALRLLADIPSTAWQTTEKNASDANMWRIITPAGVELLILRRRADGGRRRGG